MPYSWNPTGFEQESINQKYYARCIVLVQLFRFVFAFFYSQIAHIMCNCLLSSFSKRFFTSTKWFNKTESLAATTVSHPREHTHKQATNDKSVARACALNTFSLIIMIPMNGGALVNEGTQSMCITCTRSWHGQSAPIISISRNNNTTQQPTRNNNSNRW